MTFRFHQKMSNLYTLSIITNTNIAISLKFVIQDMSKLYLGKKVKEKKLVEAKSRVINPDEDILCVIRGRPKVRGGIKLDGWGQPMNRRKSSVAIPPVGLLIITNKRVIFYYKSGFGRWDQVFFPYKQLNSISHHKGMVGDEIKIYSMSDSIEIGYIPKGDAIIAVEYVKNLMEEMKPQKVEVVASEMSVDIMDQIEKLGNLKEKGLITEEEFSSKKAELLERL